MNGYEVAVVVTLLLWTFGAGMMFDRWLSRVAKRCPKGSPCRTHEEDR